MTPATSRWFFGGLVLVGFLALTKWQLSTRDRVRTSDGTKNGVTAISTTPASDAKGAPPPIASNMPRSQIAPTKQDKMDVPNDLAGSARDLTSNAIVQAASTITNALPSASKPSEGGSEQHGSKDPVGTFMELAANTVRQVDQAVLGSTELSTDEEISFGKELETQILLKLPDANQPAIELRLKKLADPIIEQCARKAIQYRIHIVSSEIVNAFSCAGGSVFITTAFLKRFPSNEQLAMVIAHEIAHVDLKHAVHTVQYLYHGKKIVGDAAAVAQIAYSFLRSPYSKEQEFEADAWGYEVCRNLGWESKPLISLLDGLKALEDERTNGHAASVTEPNSDIERRMGQYFNSHPETAERIDRLKKRQR